MLAGRTAFDAAELPEPLPATEAVFRCQVGAPGRCGRNSPNRCLQRTSSLYAPFSTRQNFPQPLPATKAVVNACKLDALTARLCENTLFTTSRRSTSSKHHQGHDICLQSHTMALQGRGGATDETGEVIDSVASQCFQASLTPNSTWSCAAGSAAAAALRAVGPWGAFRGLAFARARWQHSRPPLLSRRSRRQLPRGVPVKASAL